MNIGEKLKYLRGRSNLSQTELALKLNINRVQYNQYENNYTTIAIKHLLSIANYYNISIDFIFNLTEVKQYKNNSEVELDKAGKRLKEFRKENKLTQVKLAEILNTTFSTIGFYERGRNLIATPFLYMICTKYKISADYLLGRVDYPKYLK